MSAPHLPPKSCSIKARRQFQLLPWVLFVVLVSALTGLAIAFSAISWFFPSNIDTTVIGNRFVTTGELKMDPFLQRQVDEKMLSIYDVSKKIDDKFYPNAALVADAVVLTSDGWAVFPTRTNLPSKTSSWDVIDGQGRAHKVETRLTDETYGLTYIKIDTEGSRIMDLYGWESEKPGEVLWKLEYGVWKQIFIDREVSLIEKTPFPIWKEQFAYELLPSPKNGDVIIDESGRFVGFAREDGTLLPSWIIETQLPSLLADKKVSQLGLLYTGEVIDQLVVEGEAEKIRGFYVATSPTKLTSTTVGVGDVIVRVQNMPVSKLNLAQRVLSSPSEVIVTVLRDGVEIDIPVQKKVVGQ